MPGFRINTISDNGCNPNQIGAGITDKSKALNTIETARNHRYSLTILGMEDITTYVRSIDRPTYKPDHMVIHHGMTEINRPGKIKWEPVSVTFYEVLLSDNKLNRTAEVLYNWFIDDGYDKNAAFGGGIFNQAAANQIVKLTNSIYNLRNNLIDYRNYKDIIVELENGFGDPIWTYKLKNAWPGTVEADTLDYTNNDISHIKMSLIYDRALNIGEEVKNARV